jgi:hypothetical protein
VPQTHALAKTPIASLFATPERKVIAGAAALAIVLLAGLLTLRSRNSEPVVVTPPPSVPANPSGPTPIVRQADEGPLVAQPSTQEKKPAKPVAKQPPVPVAKQPSAPVRTPAAPPAPVTPQITFDAVPNSIPQGGTTRLRWYLTNARSARIVPAPGVLRQTTGEFLVTPAQTTTYTLTAASQDGTVATATATVQVIPQARPNVSILVHHDHGFAQNGWPQCWGQLQVMGNHLQYRVIGSSDGRRDDFDVQLSQVQEVRVNRIPIRNLQAFHVTVNGQNFNFIPQGTSSAQAVVAIQQMVNGR